MMGIRKDEEGDDGDNNDEGTRNGEANLNEDENQCWDDDVHEDEADHDVRTFTTMTITTMVVHDDDYVMTCLTISAMLTLTNKYNRSDCPGRIGSNDWERF